LTFDLYPLHCRIVSQRSVPLTPNLLRGAFGSALKKLSEEDYGRFFAPKIAAGGGPSGLANPPRPFVFRLMDPTHIGMNIFETREPVLGVFLRALHHVDAFRIESITGTELVRLPLIPNPAPVSRLRVHFVTATELKGSAQPDFGTLLSRIRDRVSTLRELYGAGPLEIDFKNFGARAVQVGMMRCDLVPVALSRTSRATGQTHSLGGFTGICEYEGDLAEFVPYLEIARWTGVGRQTVWGKGEIGYETL
jgi:hypothetical protein